jgi:hypothetical protein
MAIKKKASKKPPPEPEVSKLLSRGMRSFLDELPKKYFLHQKKKEEKEKIEKAVEAAELTLKTLQENLKMTMSEISSARQNLEGCFVINKKIEHPPFILLSPKIKGREILLCVRNVSFGVYYPTEKSRKLRVWIQITFSSRKASLQIYAKIEKGSLFPFFNQKKRTITTKQFIAKMDYPKGPILGLSDYQIKTPKGMTKILFKEILCLKELEIALKEIKTYRH